MALPILHTGAQLLTLPVSEREWFDFLDRWGLDPPVAVLALLLGYWTPQFTSTRLWILSGERSAAEQSRLRRLFDAGRLRHRPADDSLHLHGQAFDVGTDFVIGSREWAIIGAVAEALGLRWGGRFDPPDRPHFDRP